jgi:hypothetical protein
MKRKKVKVKVEGRPPGLVYALRLLTSERNWGRFLRQLTWHAPDVADVDRLIRGVIAVVCRKFNPAYGDLWHFVPTAIHNVARNLTRAEDDKELRTFPLPEDDEVGALAAEDLTELLHARIDHQAFRAALCQHWGRLNLPEGYTLFLRYYVGLSLQEVANLGAAFQPGETVAAVKSCLQRAQRKLRRPLAPFHPRGHCAKLGKNPPTHGRQGRRPRGGARGAAR